MKSRTCMLMAVAGLALCQPQIAAAQSRYQGSQSQGIFNNQMSVLASRGQVQGIFGNQTVGMPSHGPVLGIFGVQNAGLSMEPYSNRAGGRNLTNPTADFTNPLGLYGPTVAGAQMMPDYVAAAIQPPAPVPAIPMQAPGPVYNLTEVQAAPQTTAPTNPEADETEGADQAADGQTAAPTGPPTFSYVTQSPATTPAAHAALARPQYYARSPELSDRLTRIARQKGMLSGEGIDVYLGDRVARLEGMVRTSGDRSLLANVVGLEPEVKYVDNRLTTEGARSLSANRTSR